MMTAPTLTPDVPNQPGQKTVSTLSPWREAWRVFRGNKAAMLGLVTLILIMLVMLVGPAWYAVDPFGIVAPPFHEPFVDSRYWLGSDYLGRDIVAKIQQWHAQERQQLQAELERQLERRDIANATLATRPTQKARNDLRVAGNRIGKALSHRRPMPGSLQSPFNR